jgi:hypothetical protein
MHWDDAYTVFQEIKESTRDDTTLITLEKEIVEAAVRYARMRTDWAIQDPDQRKEADAYRTIAHNRFIDACNILSRTMRKRGKDISWRARLGQDRGEIGDFACYIHCILGLSAR